MWMFHGKPDPTMMCNCMLAGLVAITAPVRVRHARRRLHHRRVAGVLVVWSVFFFDRSKIDDPVGAISVHGVNGAWGVHRGRPLRRRQLRHRAGTASAPPSYLGTSGAALKGVTGLFYGDHKQLVAQLVEVVVCVGWNVVVGGLAFWVIGKVLGSNRVSAEVEIAGLDVPEMGVPGYPEFVPPVAPEQVPAAEVEEAKAMLATAKIAMAK